MPQSETIAALARIWSDVLEVQATAGESFLELGGDSMLATQITWRVAQEFHVTLPFVAFFEGATLIEMAERIDRLRQEEPASSLSEDRLDDIA